MEGMEAGAGPAAGAAPRPRAAPRPLLLLLAALQGAALLGRARALRGVTSWISGDETDYGVFTSPQELIVTLGDRCVHLCLIPAVSAVAPPCGSRRKYQVRSL